MDLLEEVLDRADHLVGLSVHWAVLLLHAPFGVALERVLEAARLGQLQLMGVDGGVHHAVQDEPSHRPRIVLGIGHAQLGPVGEAQIVQLVLAQSRTDDVHIPDRGDGVHMFEHRTGALFAVFGELGGLFASLLLGLLLIQVVLLDLLAIGVHPLIVQALHRGRTVDPARVEAHHVILIGHRVGEGAVELVGHDVIAGGSRAARIGQQVVGVVVLCGL